MAIDSIGDKKVFDNIEALLMRGVVCATQNRILKANDKFKHWLAVANPSFP